VTKTTVYDEDGHLVHRPGPGAVAWLLQSHGIKVYAPESWREDPGKQSS
jgi:hypothetical protein